MIIDNENKKLSRNRKRIIERRFKIDHKLKILLNKIKSVKKKKNKIYEEIEQLEILLFTIKRRIKIDHKLKILLNKIKSVKKKKNKIYEEID